MTRSTHYADAYELYHAQAAILDSKRWRLTMLDPHEPPERTAKREAEVCDTHTTFAETRAEGILAARLAFAFACARRWPRTRWLLATLGEDGEQAVRLAAVEAGPELAHIRRAVRRQLGRAARDYGILRPWETLPREPLVSVLPATHIRDRSREPARQARITGYRQDSARHIAARAKVPPERRRKIATMGAAARTAARKEACPTY